MEEKKRRIDEEREAHKFNFEEEIFGQIDDEATDGRIMTTARYNLIAEFLRDVGKSESMKRWKNEKKLLRLYEIRRKYILKDEVLYYHDQNSFSRSFRKERKVAKWNEIFDIIYTQHFGSSNHRSYSNVWNSIKEVWANITENQCRIFQEYCKFCQISEPRRKKHKGSNKPIRSMSFRDRFQIDLIDYKEQAAYDFPDDKDIRKLYEIISVGW